MATAKIDVKTDLHKSDKELDKVDKSLKGMGDQAKKADKVTKGLWKQFAVGGLAVGAARKAMRLMTDQVKDTIKTGLAFGKEWANVTTMLSVSEGEADNLKKELIKLSPTLGDTTELAKGMYQVLSASVEPAKAIEFLGEAAKSAKAGVTDITTSVDALTTVINAYGLRAEDVTSVSDIMFKTVKRGKLTYEGMAGAIGTIVPVAAQLNIGFEEVAAAMATMTKKGIDVNTTTTQLRQIMMAVLKPQESAMILAKKLGINFTAQGMAAKGLSVWLADVKEKTNNDSEAMSALFGNVRALSGVLALAGGDAQTFAGDLLAMKDASGATEEAFQKQMESASFWVETFKNQTKKMKIVFFESFVEQFKLGVESSQELEHELRVMTKEAELAGGGFGRLAKAVWGGVKSLGDLLPAGRMQRKEIKRLAEGIIVLEDRHTAYNKTLDKATGLFKDVGTSVKDYIGKLTEYKLESEKSEETTKLFAEAARILKFEIKELKTPTELLTKEVEEFKRVMNEIPIELEGVPATIEGILESVDFGAWADNSIEASKGMGVALTEQELKVLESMERQAEETAAFIEGVASDIGISFGAFAIDILEGQKTLGESIKDLWGGIKRTFFGIIGDMVKEFATNLVKNVITGAVNMGTAMTKAGGVMQKTGKAISGIGEGIGKLIENLATGIGKAIEALAKSIANAARSLAAAAPQIAVVGAVALALFAGFQAIKAIFAGGGKSAKAGTEYLKDIRNKLYEIWNDSQWMVKAFLGEQQGRLDNMIQKADWNLAATEGILGYQEAIKDNLDNIEDHTKNMLKELRALPKSGGGDYFEKPTLTWMGDKGPEYAIPASKISKGTGGNVKINVNINSPLISTTGDVSQGNVKQAAKALFKEIKNLSEMGRESLDIQTLSRSET